jgi:hypothetical protein
MGQVAISCRSGGHICCYLCVSFMLLEPNRGFLSLIGDFLPLMTEMPRTSLEDHYRDHATHSLELVVGKLDVVAQFAANEEIRKVWDPK